MHRVANACRNLLIASLVAGCGAAHAIPIVGVPVDSIGSGTAVATSDVDTDGTINFYIPLRSSTSGTFGVDNGSVIAGTDQDQCSFPSTCGSGTLDMILRFTPVTPGPNILSLDFVDLDLDLPGVSDPWYFLESLFVYDADGDELASITSLGTSGSGLVITADDDDQLIQLPVIADDPFFVRLTFSSSFDSNTHSGTYANTEEHLLATIVEVPSPGAITVLGSSLLGLAWYRRRSRPRRALH